MKGRFSSVPVEKAAGVAYTPPAIAALLAEKLAGAVPLANRRLSILEPALGDGALALALLRAVFRQGAKSVRLVGHETDERAAAAARDAVRTEHPSVELDLRTTDFLTDHGDERFDLAIANPPFVRTQILGASGAKSLARRYGLTGRVDLYQAFALRMIERLARGGALGLVLSNRFLSTEGAAAFRDALNTKLALLHLWDLGDTKVFDVAVLPALLVGREAGSAAGSAAPARFTSIYEDRAARDAQPVSLIDALDREGPVRLGERTFRVTQGALHARPGEPWRVSSGDVDGFLRAVEEHTWKRIGDVGRIRVGIKTTADSVFIRDDWRSMGDGAPELLRPVITHHVAARYRGAAPSREVLYPHVKQGGRRRAADLALHPKARDYLARHRPSLERRDYLLAAGRAWYEIWVPHDPELWRAPKLVFRDISERPTFWLDESGSVVNGDCYWLSPASHAQEGSLWLALAVANSTFVEAFYDRCFHNRLYSRRRRFMSQYVAKFPLPSPHEAPGRRLAELAKERYACESPAEQRALESTLDALTWEAFGLRP